MPCQGGPSTPPFYKEEIDKLTNFLCQAPPFYKEEIDKLTNFLCQVCKMVEDNSLVLPYTVTIWWEEHQKIDRDRLLKEKWELEKDLLKQRALQKLTYAEKKVLGL